MERPEREVPCPECGKNMELMLTDGYYTDLETRIALEVYHCAECMRDEQVEEVWQLMNVSRRQFFHG